MVDAVKSSGPTPREAAVGLALAGLWAAITVYETLTTSPWNEGDVFVRASQIVGSSLSGLIVSAGLVWLAGRSGVFRSA
jgi:hypothetical protein